ncbi:hypothetical protein KEM48_003192 [Puccinia striiformis f. sp. tritici PST-130]|nr:hypothetical protein KEM48_003192 [Puccinia striiformis f. sp. tritici PST-130]
MSVQHSPKAPRAPRSARLAPAAPVNGTEYTPEELERMTPDERLWLAEHPLRLVPRNPEDQIDLDDSIDAPEAYSDADLDNTSDAHMSASSENFPLDAMFPPPDSTLAKLKLREYDLATPSTIRGGPSRIMIPPVLPTLACVSTSRPAAPKMPNLYQFTSRGYRPNNNCRDDAPQADDPYQYWSKDVGAIFKRWSFANCPKYNGTVKMDVRSWLKKMEMFLAIHLAHPVIWSQFGLLMLTGRAVRDMEVLHSSKKTITTWEEFSAWITSADPLSVSKHVVAEQWETLRMGPNESFEKFYKRFQEWLALAHWYKFQFDACTGLSLRLSSGLKTKINNLMAVEERKGTPMDFDTIVLACMDKDNQYRSTLNATSSASGSKRPAKASSSSSKKTKPNDSGKRVCYNCHGENHVSSKCPEPKTEKQLKYKAKRTASGSNSVSLNV